MKSLIILYFIIMDFAVLSFTVKSIVIINKGKVDIKEELKKLFIQKTSAPSIKTRTNGCATSAKA